MKEIKIFGLRRTGTNYLQNVFNRNYRGRIVNTGGWKHGNYKVKQVLGHELDCVVISKNIYSWLTSLHKRYKNWPFYKIVETADWIEMYNFAYSNWLDIPKKLKNKKCVFVKYEDLVEHPKEECQKIATTLNIERSNKNFNDITQVILPDKIIDKQFNKSYYLNHHYLKQYNNESKHLIKLHIDLNVVQRLGYSKDTLL